MNRRLSAFGSAIMTAIAGVIPMREDRARVPERRQPVTDEDLEMLAPIVAFARGDQEQREAAITRHRELLTSHPHLRSHPAQVFMAEVDTPCPDLGMRAEARVKAAGGRRASDRRAA